MVSFLNTSRNTKLKTRNTKTETLLYTAAHRQPHIIKKIQRTLQDQNHEASRYTCCCPRQHYRQKYVKIISIPAPYSPYAKGMTSQSHGEQHPLVNVNKGVKCGRIFGLYHKLIYIYKAIRRRRANQSQRSRARTSSSSARWPAQTRLTKEQERTKKTYK